MLKQVFQDDEGLQFSSESDYLLWKNNKENLKKFSASNFYAGKDIFSEQFLDDFRKFCVIDWNTDELGFEKECDKAAYKLHSYREEFRKLLRLLDGEETSNL